MPGEVISYRGGKETRRYCRFGGDDGHEPLIFVRDFHGSHPDYLEVAEEFRHYFNLFEGKANGILRAEWCWRSFLISYAIRNERPWNWI